MKHFNKNNKLNSFELVPIGEPKSLRFLYPGTIFLYNNILALKTEYLTDEGCIEAYILNTGELFWGHAKTIDELYNIVVQPMMLRKKENV